MGMHAAFDGAYIGSRKTMSFMSPTCSSGDCEWLPYGTLGLCAEVANLTAQGNITLLASLRRMTADRLGILLNSTTSLIEQMQSGSGSDMAVGLVFPLVILSLPIPTGALDPSLLSLVMTDHFIGYSDAPINVTEPVTTAVLERFKFIEIANYWCTKAYRTRVKDGIPMSEEIESHARLIQGPPAGLNFAWLISWYACHTNSACNSTAAESRSQLEAPPAAPGGRYEINIWSALAGSMVADRLMYDSTLMDQQRSILASFGGGVGAPFATALFGEHLSGNRNLPRPELQLEAVRNISINMAASTTNLSASIPTTCLWSEMLVANQCSMRRITYAGDEGPGVVIGTAYSPQTFVLVHWRWIALLAVQLVLASLFLIAIIVETRVARLQILKGSTLATMCALDGAARDAVGGIGNFDGMRKKANALGVRLERGASGTALWLATSSRFDRTPWRTAA
jgi:hypothetical protein